MSCRSFAALLAATALTTLTALAGTAAAETKIQVLQADGRADAKVRAKIDAALLAVAKSSGVNVIPGDITFTDAAAAVGCKPTEAACKDEVLGMLSVDEIVVTTVTPKSGGFEVAVRRLGKGAAAREAINFVAFDRVDRLDTLAPLFSTKLAPASTSSPEPVTAVPFDSGQAATSGTPPSTGTPRTASPIETRPDPYTADLDARPPNRRLQVAGMVGGGAMVLVGLVLWGTAANLQSNIDDAPDETVPQIRALQDLESRGDGYAIVGNALVASGLVVGGISTLYFIKRGRSSERARSARLVPVVVDGGGGIALTFGGTP